MAQGEVGLTPRKPWVAGLLSVLQLGLGHVYAGRWRRGVVVWVLARATEIAVVFLMSIEPASLILATAFAGLLSLTAAVAWDAMDCARRADPSFTLRAYNRWYVYVSLFVLQAGLLQRPYVALLRIRLEAFKVASASMRPGLLPGDFLLATRLGRPPARGAVVVCHVRGQDYLKRVMALPGDTIAMQAGTLIIDSHALAEPYAIREGEAEVRSPDFQWQQGYLIENDATALYRPTQATWGPLRVPAGAYFVLGDNRDDSFDSRYSGFVLADSIGKRAMVLYFSIDPDTKLPRWGRIGRSIQ